MRSSELTVSITIKEIESVLLGKFSLASKKALFEDVELEYILIDATQYPETKKK
jgi:hypothetical protein